MNGGGERGGVGLHGICRDNRWTSVLKLRRVSGLLDRDHIEFRSQRSAISNIRVRVNQQFVGRYLKRKNWLRTKFFVLSTHLPGYFRLNDFNER